MRISDWSSDVCSSDLLRPLLAPIEDDMHRGAIDTDHLEVGGDGGRAVGWNFQQAVAQIEMPRQDARRDRQSVDAGIEHTETAGIPYPLLTRMPAADILFQDDIDAAETRTSFV